MNTATTLYAYEYCSTGKQRVGFCSEG